MFRNLCRLCAYSARCTRDRYVTDLVRHDGRGRGRRRPWHGPCGGAAWGLCRAAAALPALVLHPSCPAPRPGRAENCWGGAGLPNSPRHLRRHELDPTSRRRTGRRVAVRGVGPPHAPLRRLARSGACRAARPSWPATQTRTGSRNATLGAAVDAAETPPTAPWRRRSASSRPRNPSLRCGFWTARGGAVKVAWQSSRTKIEQRRA